MAAIQKLKRRALQVEAIQFTGTNGAQVVAYARENFAGNVDARNGGTYVSIHVDEKGVRLRKGDWLVRDVDDAPVRVTDAELDKYFSGRK